MAICTIITPDGENKLSFDPPMRLSALLAEAGAPVDMPCGGRGTCGKCRVWAEGNLDEPSSEELRFLSAGQRLACRAMALGDVTLRTAKRAGDRIVTDGELPDFTPDCGRGLGVAVDIGTTTVAAYLYDLATAERLAVASRPNPQAVFGADVLSRIGKSMDGEAEALSAAVAGAIYELVGELTAQAGAARQDVASIVITGNTAMLYLLTGRNPESIAKVPFIPDNYFGETISAAPFGIKADGVAYLARSVSAYVGADITCSMMAAGFVGGSDTALLADIGTNGEMALIHGGKILCCSTAAGPAFEGAGIYMGMNAREGAITAVELMDGALDVQYIGETPTGICGSGIVDLLAALLDAGVIDESGRMLADGHDFEDAITSVNGQIAFRIPGTEIVLTQADVRAVQLAKAAIHAGMLTLIEEAGLDPADVPLLLIAGGFGSCIRPESAEMIGLIPAGFAQKSRQIGNAAGAGASMLLLSHEELKKGEALSKSCDVVELSTNPFFMDEYVESMAFENSNA